MLNSSKMSSYQQYIHLSRYARWLPAENRRETWEETVSRYFDFFDKHLTTRHKTDKGLDLSQRAIESIRKMSLELEKYILELEIMPSMRCLAVSGPALERCHVAAYNCAADAPGYYQGNKADNIAFFSESFYILLCGTGEGASVERQFINQLPVVANQFNISNEVIVVEDSKKGWAVAYRDLVSDLYDGVIRKFDVSKVRPSGARLKTFGGRASGPEPLLKLRKLTVDLFKQSAGRKLTSVEIADLFCHIGSIVVVGGVRRTALAILSNLSDQRMRDYKTGEWWHHNPQRSLANISTAYTEKPDIYIFMKEWSALYESKSGERGIFNREAAINQTNKSGRRQSVKPLQTTANPNYIDFLSNPCFEIILRPQEFCNLTEVIVRAADELVDLVHKVKLATILGTWQSTLTDFDFLNPQWAKNCREERLLGVSLSGIMDNRLLNNNHEELPDILEILKQTAIDTNKIWADLLGINQSVAITCVKPSGTVSQRVNCASGIHPRHSQYYIRRVRADIKDPLSDWMILKGFSYEMDKMNPQNYVFSFPIESPKNSVLRKDVSAIEHLELWLTYQRFWCEHKPSVTVSVKEDEWLEVGAWCYKNFDELSGVSFLPYSEHNYQQAPYEEIEQLEYEKMAANLPVAEWSGFFEYDDYTTSAQEYACVGNQCEV